MTPNDTPLTSSATSADGPVPPDDAVDPPYQRDEAAAAQDHGADPAAAGSAADPADAVWTSSSLEHEPHEPTARRVRTGTVTWGLILACLGGLLVAIGLGVRVDLVLTSIILLAGLGVAIIVLALLPRRTGSKTT